MFDVKTLALIAIPVVSGLVGTVAVCVHEHRERRKRRMLEECRAICEYLGGAVIVNEEI